MKIQTGKEVLDFLNDSLSLQQLYDKMLPAIERYVTKNSGDKQDAKDLFQEAVVVVFKKAKEVDFQLTSSLETFIFSISKRQWLYELRKKKGNLPFMEIVDSSGNEFDELIIKEERDNLYIKHFEKLSASCKDILRLFFSGLKMAEIANQLNFASEGYARKRKHECQTNLVKLIKDDPHYLALKA